MIAQFFTKIFGTANARELKRLESLVRQINQFEPAISALTDEQLSLKTVEFREQIARGRTLDEILPEAFAVVREASKRKLGQRHYDVQLIGGIVLHQGKIAEMKTGEGKTLTATLPLYLNALAGKGAHLITVNDYLARHQGEWMGQVYSALGMNVGIIQNNFSDAERKKAYASDITYGTNNEFGFDYLRDNMKFRLDDYVQRELSYAIVDEVDSILIDEARTPLIISGASDESSKLYTEANRVIPRLSPGTDYEIDEKARSAQLTESGNDKVEQAFGIDNLYDVEHLKLLHHVNQALRAHALFKRDVEYVVRDGQVLIVDEFTGRILPGRRYSDGLHQALEAKENVDIERESQTLASITLQNYFRLYGKLGGMTGTAATEAEEFHKIYKLEIISIPTNKPMIRVDQPDLIFLTKNAKYQAIVEDVKARHEKGQPVLIGTIAIETSELLSAILDASGVPHDVLNAKNHAREADIVQHAGEKGRVTIATNMAGRGTDIKLTPESVDAGGLYILGTERHESRRIDNQLRGRAGRQGDPGESRFYISLEDDLIRVFAGEGVKKSMQRMGMQEDEVIESPFISKTIARSQEKVEKHNFDLREHLLKYDDVLNQQRIVIYRYRREILDGVSIVELVRELITQSINDVLGFHAQDKRELTPESREEVIKAVAHVTGLPINRFEKDLPDTLNVQALKTALIDLLTAQYDLYRNQQNAPMVQQAEKWLMLESIDNAWKQHMLNLDHLKEGIQFRSWGQKNPLIEYKREAFDMFTEMMRAVRWEIVHHIFHVNLEHFDAAAFEQKREMELSAMNMQGTSLPGEEAEVRQPRVAAPKIGRNDDCPCGSGKKNKKCCSR